MKKICVACDKTKDISENKIYKSIGDNLPSLTKKLGYKTNFPFDKLPDLSTIKAKHEINWNMTINIDLGSRFKNRYILYFAAKPKKALRIIIYLKKTHIMIIKIVVLLNL